MGRPGSFIIPQWNVLNYLERVSQQLDKSDGSIAGPLMEIVRAIADYREVDGQRIDNYGTDYVITKVMANVARSSGYRKS